MAGTRAAERPTRGTGCQPVPLTNVLSEVQETLLMPLWARALQSRRWCHILDDPKAAEVAAEIDYDFSKFEKSVQTEIGCVLRALQFDAWVTDFFARHPRGTIVDVGAGLNSRFERTDNGRGRFFELDLPEAMAIRKQFFTENERRTHLVGSVLDSDWTERVRTTGGPWLVVIEGVLMYLSEAEVRRLFAMISRELPGAWIAFDSLSRRGVEAQHRYAAMRHFDARFDWAIDETRRIEEWNDEYLCIDNVNLRHVAMRNRHKIPALVQKFATFVATLLRSTVDDYWMTLYRLGGVVP